MNIEQSLVKMVAKELNLLINSKMKKIQVRTQDLVKEVIENSPIYARLVGGDLAGHFGLPRGTEATRVERILNVLISHIYSTFFPLTVHGSNLRGGFLIGLDGDVYKSLVGLDAALVHTDKGEILPWLHWLLLAGDQVIVREYHVVFKAAGRSGKAVMVPTGVWSVPSNASGTENDNWFIRSVDTNAFDLGFINIITSELN